jgi:FkbM family methyltransferase
MRKFILKLTGSSAIRKTVKFLRLHLLANWWLNHFPNVKILAKSGVRYRARRVESLALSVEMFDKESLYGLSDLPENMQTFADLGCNVGYFSCWLVHSLNNRQLKGLMVDANKDCVEDAQWHVTANNMSNVHALFGLAGTDGKDGKATFFVHTAANMCSTTAPPEASAADTTTWKKMEAPCLNIEENWRKLVGDTPCDLLKLDIEGSEMDFIRNETKFLSRTKTIFIEWHKWQGVTLDGVKNLLSAQGFTLKRVLQEDDVAGTAVFTKKTTIS